MKGGIREGRNLQGGIRDNPPKKYRRNQAQEMSELIHGNPMYNKFCYNYV
jgi:hypothetical protein